MFIPLLLGEEVRPCLMATDTVMATGIPDTVTAIDIQYMGTVIQDMVETI